MAERARAPSFFSCFIVGGKAVEDEPGLRNELRAGTIVRMTRSGRRLGRGAGIWSIAVAAWEIWNRVPKRHRKRLLKQARRHGPALAKRAYRARRDRRRH